MSEQTQPIMLDFAKLKKLIINDLNKSTSKDTVLARKYSKEQIARFLENPLKNGKQLRELSNFLYITSANYRRLILYFAQLPTFDYIVEPLNLNKDKINIDKFKKDYDKTLSSLENMNIAHEFLKILKVAFREDTFFGYEYQAKDSYFISPLNPDYCEISSIEDGVYNFQFDFSYFDKNKEKLEEYADEFKIKYNLYKNNKDLRWQELESTNSICIKVVEDIPYPIPPFSIVFESLFDIDESKRLNKIKNKMENYMILTQQIPIDDKSGEANKFLIDLDTAVEFHNRAVGSLPNEVGLVTSPMKIEAIKLEKRQTDRDSVAQAERDYYNSAGVSQFLFNSEKIIGSGLTKSITTDEQIVFGLLRQLERWLNRKLKQNSTTYKFKVKLLDITVFNKKEVQEQYLKSAQYGMPVKLMLGASLGLSPSSMNNMTYLENEILGLQDTLIPLSSSHTLSGKDGAGKPKKNEDELTESGTKTSDTDGNIRE